MPDMCNLLTFTVLNFQITTNTEEKELLLDILPVYYKLHKYIRTNLNFVETRFNACKKENVKLFLAKTHFASAKPTHHQPEKSLFFSLARLSYKHTWPSG